LGADATTAWAQLNGRLTRFHTNLTLYFDYGLTPALGTVIVPSDVPTVSDSLTHYFRAFPSPVDSNKLYFYRAIAVSTTDTFYSDIRGFYTGVPYSLHQYLPATNVTDSSVDVNGQTQGFDVPVKLKVEIFNSNNYHTIRLFNIMTKQVH